MLLLLFPSLRIINRVPYLFIVLVPSGIIRNITSPSGSNSSLDQYSVDNVEYYFENGLRKVRPHKFTYIATTKGRWMQKTLPQIFEQEFGRRCDGAMIIDAIQTGKLTVNGVAVSPDYRLKNNDVIETKDAHRHEPPVPDHEIKIIHREDSIIVVDKPPGIPVHSNSLYQFNTIARILQQEHGVGKNMVFVNRLDGPTQGVLILVNSKRHAAYQKQLIHHQLSKEYLCRVVGRFPEKEIECDTPLHSTSVLPSKVTIASPQGQGKPSQTIFNRVKYFPHDDTSLVHCKPQTGRRHQIRVHLALLGHPITNDPLYNPQFPRSNRIAKFYDQLEDVTEGGRQANGNETLKDRLSLPLIYIPLWPTAELPCRACAHPAPDPNPEDMIIFLKAIRYAGKGWEFTAERPTWAGA